MKKRELAPQAAENTVIAEENPLAATGVEKMILVIRDKQVLLDRDLATLYGVETRRINEQVKRNIARFPEDFCFQLNRDEIEFVKSQIATSRGEGFFSGQKGGGRKSPYAFTEQGVAMLSSVLKSESAIRVNIAIMRAFVQLRHYMMENAGVVNRLMRVEGKEIEQDRRLLEHDRKIDSLFEAMDRREADWQKVMENFIDPSTYKHFLILNGCKLEADVAYTQIYGMAKKSLLIVDNYVDVKTLNLLRNVPKGISVQIFSDLLGGSRMTEDMLADYRAARPDVLIDVKPALHKFHDRYIFVDFKTSSEKLFHCGASSKDAGNKITTIVQLDDIEGYRPMFEELQKQPDKEETQSP
ncbi:MAG: ORF6N domain-containing protein [Fibrobacter sp.]|nr:ORF6N domain-containing protein [Fibrobacter sp.]